MKGIKGNITGKMGSWSVRMKIVSAVCGCLLVAAGAYAATNWVVGLNAGSSGEGQSADDLEPDHHRGGLTGGGQPALSGGKRRRGRDHRQPEPVPR